MAPDANATNDATGEESNKISIEEGTAMSLSRFLGKRVVSTWDPTEGRRYRYADGSEVQAGPGYTPHHSTRFVNWGSETSSPVAARALPELYRERSECCGCCACEAVCPYGAIAMEPDEEGFLYPVVDAVLCISCGSCERACAFKSRILR